MLRLLLILGIIGSCTAPLPDAGYPGHPDPRLKAQLAFSVDGKEYPTGTGVIQRQSLSKISVNLPDKTTLLLVNTCARQDEFWSPDTRKPFVYSYTPAFDVETSGSCPMYITAVTSQGEWYRSILDFTNAATAEATVDVMCNGRWITAKGAYLCQVASDLPIRVTSSKAAVFEKDPTAEFCDSPKGTPLTPMDRSWDILVKSSPVGKPGICIYVLINKDREEFRLTTSGYSSILKVFPPK